MNAAESTVTVRFAPSPSGRLHVGNVRIAILNWLLSRKAGGRFILRFDDTDTERSREEYVRMAEEDLGWLGLAWDEKVRQSARLDRYRAAIDKLKVAERLYPCYETPEELALKRKMLLSRGKPPIYDRAALQLDATAHRKFETEGRAPHWRFRLEDGEIRWMDGVRGDVHFEAENVSDPVLIRADGTPLFILPSVVDDIDFKVTDVLRGEDHVTNTAVQIQIFEALEAKPPRFAHLPLLTDLHGKGLSKREDSLAVSELRDEGLEPMALNSLLALIGSSDPVAPFASLEALLPNFDLRKFARATPKFDPDELASVNAKLLHELPFSEVVERLRAIGLDHVDEGFWLAVRENLARLSDALGWWRVCHAEIAPVVEDADFARKAAALLPEGEWGADTWQAWTDEVKKATGRKGKALYHPLRLALTGCERGPELQNLLPMIGRKRAVARLQGQTA
ncbi:MAG: glutamate--tRNA ligase [Alphaproteobacteria bacterium]|nr:glutamate--tRNA ligase [Alphaproteobacteria bacterium]